jgi:3-(3-hydroxy-phenyl)propionate hydroxylase
MIFIKSSRAGAGVPRSNYVNAGKSASYDVCVVGFGPVGAALTAALGLRGLNVLAVDRSAEIYPQPRAAHIDGEAMRLFQALGIAQAVLPHTRPAPPYQFVNPSGEILMAVPAAAIEDDGWPNHLMIYQPGIERALRNLCAVLPTVEVRLGSSFVSLEQGASSVSAHFDGGHVRTVSAHLLIGCDGASSPVRESIGVELEDFGFDEPWLVIDAVALDDARTPNACIQLCDPARPTTFTWLGPGRLRWEFMLRPNEHPASMMSDETIAELLVPWGGSEGLLIERRAVYRFHGLIAKSWRLNRVLLAGDAAHQMPPFAGQGLCTGLRDASNLAWKIAQCLRGGPLDALLDSYQIERAPHVREIVTMAIAAGRLVCTMDPHVAQMRDAKAREERAAGVNAPGLPMPSIGASDLQGGSGIAGTRFPQIIADNGLKSDDVFGSGACLIERKRSSETAHPGLRRFALDDPELGCFKASLGRWFERVEGDAVLVRPDRIVFDSGSPEYLINSWTMLTHAVAARGVAC